MNRETFIGELKELMCTADWHRQYFAERSRKYHRIDFWIKSSIGLVSLTGAALVGNSKFVWLGGIIAGIGAFVIANVLPNFKWDSIVHGFKEEQGEWTRIHQGYEDLLRNAEISDKDEILIQEFQRVREMQNTAGLNERNLPKDQKLLDKLEKQVRAYHKS